MSVESFDPKQQAVTVTPAALAHFRRQLGGQQGGTSECEKKWLHRLQVCH